MSWTEGAPPRYFATLEREGPWWNVTFRDCPGCITFGTGRHEAMRKAADALATWCLGVPLLRLPRATGPRPGEVLVTARFSRSPGTVLWWGGKPALGRMAARWIDQAGGWR